MHHHHRTQWFTRDSLPGAGVIAIVSVIDNLVDLEHKSGTIASELVVIFLLVLLLWNGNYAINCRLENTYEWHRNPVRRIAANLLLTVVYTVTLTWIASYVYLYLYLGLVNRSADIYVNILVCTLIALLVNTVYLAIAFFKEWRKSLLEKEELKRESLSAEFETLKNQVNPHFLFNSLNTLTSLIEDDPKTATQFVQRMSDVYRYVLAQRDRQTATLGEELGFIDAYLYLNRLRFGDNLRVVTEVPAQYHSRQLPTLTLQMLVENCIKHNVISVQHPLHIYLGVVNGKMVVKNNLQPRKTVTSSNGVGLANIIHRYRFLSDEEVVVTNDGNEFKVEVPLL